VNADSGLPTVDCSLAIIALGSNLGDSVNHIRSAMDRLQRCTSAPLLRSSLYRSVPEDCPPGSPDFINAVVALVPDPGATPESLLGTLQSLEREAGRRPKMRVNEARPLDLDLIVFGQERRCSPGLTLPHPRAHRRRFVIEPLAEIMPHLVLPGHRETVECLSRRLAATGELRRLT